MFHFVRPGLPPGSALFLLLALPAAHAQGPVVVHAVGDPAQGIGLASSFGKLRAAESGRRWLEVFGTNPDPNIDSAILADGALIVREGDAASNGWVRRFVDLDLNATGDVATVLHLGGTPLGFGDDYTLYRNGSLVAQEGDSCLCPELSSQALWDNFHLVGVDDAGGLVVRADYTDAGILGSLSALARMRTDGAGVLLEEELLLLEGRAGPTGELVRLVGASAGHLSVSGNGGWMAMAKVGPDVTRDSVLLVDGNVVGREGDPSPIPGRRFGDLGGTHLARNGAGQFAFLAFLDGDPDSDEVLVLGNLLVAQEGAAPPGLPAETIDRFEEAPILLAEDGTLFWHARLDSGRRVHLRDDEVLLEEGVSRVGGLLVTELLGTSTAYTASDDGRHWLAWVRLEDGTTAIVAADFGAVVPLPGCGANPGRLTHVHGEARPGRVFRLALDGGPAPGALPLLLWSTTSLAGPGGCGLATSFGELLVDPAPGRRLGTQVGAAWTGSPVLFPVLLPPDPALTGLAAFAQGGFWDPATGTITLSDALRVEIGTG